MCIPSGKVRSKLQALKHVPHTVNDIFDQYAGEKGILNIEDVQQILKAQVNFNMVICGSWGGGDYLLCSFNDKVMSCMSVEHTHLWKSTGVSPWSSISTASRQWEELSLSLLTS
jgi:hypothetical protein